jgi:hypothetical protein
MGSFTSSQDSVLSVPEKIEGFKLKDRLQIISQIKPSELTADSFILFLNQSQKLALKKHPLNEIYQ